MGKFNYWLFERYPKISLGKPRIEEIGCRDLPLTTAATTAEIQKAIMDTFPDHISKRKDLVLLC